MTNTSNEFNLWTRVKRRHLLLFSFCVFLSSFGLFDLLYFFYGFQPILFWANDFLVIGSSAALFVVVLVSVEYALFEYDQERIKFQRSNRNDTAFIVKPLGIGIIAQRALDKSIQPLWLSAINIIQIVFLIGIASYYLGIQYGTPGDNIDAIFIVAGAATIIIGFAILENLLWSREGRNLGIRYPTTEIVDNRSYYPESLHDLRSRPINLSNAGASGISQGEFISLLDKVILSDEFKTGKND